MRRAPPCQPRCGSPPSRLFFNTVIKSMTLPPFAPPDLLVLRPARFCLASTIESNACCTGSVASLGDQSSVCSAISLVSSFLPLASGLPLTTLKYPAWSRTSSHSGASTGSCPCRADRLGRRDRAPTRAAYRKPLPPSGIRSRRSCPRRSRFRSRPAEIALHQRNATKLARQRSAPGHAGLHGEHPEQASGSTRSDVWMIALACLLLLGAALVGLCHLLPWPRPVRSFRAALLVLGGFILAEGGLSIAIAGLGLMPKGPFHDLLHHLTDYEGERPVVL